MREVKVLPTMSKAAHRRRSSLLIVAFVLCYASGPVYAASQGDLDASSSATAKITLRILPRTESPATSAQQAQGHQALRAYCQGSAAFNRPEHLFQADLLHPQLDRHPALVDSVLRSGCSGAEAQALGLEPEDDQITVMIAPL